MVCTSCATVSQQEEGTWEPRYPATHRDNGRDIHVGYHASKTLRIFNCQRRRNTVDDCTIKNRGALGFNYRASNGVNSQTIVKTGLREEWLVQHCAIPSEFHFQRVKKGWAISQDHLESQLVTRLQICQTAVILISPLFNI